MAAIQAFQRTFTGFHRRLAAAAGNDVSLADVFVLHHIAHAGTVTAGQVAGFTGLTSGAVTSVLDRLEKADLIQRTRSTQDRRVVLIELPAAALERLTQMMDRAHGEVGEVFAGWDIERLEALVTLLDDLQMDPDDRAQTH